MTEPLQHEDRIAGSLATARQYNVDRLIFVATPDGVSLCFDDLDRLIDQLKAKSGEASVLGEPPYSPITVRSGSLAPTPKTLSREDIARVIEAAISDSLTMDWPSAVERGTDAILNLPKEAK